MLMQATVQATLANLPMDQVQSAYKPTDPAYAENMRWAEEALVTAVFCIIICGAWGTLSIRYLAPFLLQKVRRQYHEPLLQALGPYCVASLQACTTPHKHPRPQSSVLALLRVRCSCGAAGRTHAAMHSCPRGQTLHGADVSHCSALRNFHSNPY